MRLIGVVGVLVIGVGCGAASALPPPLPYSDREAGPPLGSGLVFETTRVDVGEVYDDGLAWVEFPFVNAGPAPIEITRVSAGCGSRSRPLAKTVYEPGESGVIHAALEARARCGNVRKGVHLSTSDPERPNVSLYITGYVRPIVRVEPAGVLSGMLEKGQVVAREFAVYADREDFEVVWVSTTRPDLVRVEVIGSAVAEYQSQTFRRVRLRAEFAGSSRVGRTEAEIVIRTNDERRPEVRVWAMAYVQPDVVVEPLASYVGVVEVGEAFRHEVEIRHRHGRPFRILGVELTGGPPLDIGSLSWSAIPREEGAYRIEFEGRLARFEGQVRERIVVRTDVEGEERVEFLMTVRSRR